MFVVDGVTVKNASDLVSCLLYTKAVARLPWLSCYHLHMKRMRPASFSLTITLGYISCMGLKPVPALW